MLYKHFDLVGNCIQCNICNLQFGNKKCMFYTPTIACFFLFVHLLKDLYVPFNENSFYFDTNDFPDFSDHYAKNKESIIKCKFKSTLVSS